MNKMISHKNGALLEERFNKWLFACQPCAPGNPNGQETYPEGRTAFNGDRNIFMHVYVSCGQREAPMDFWAIILPDLDTLVYFDVVDHHPKGESIELNTGHKDWKAILEYCKKHMEELNEMYKDHLHFEKFKAYITYSPTSGLADDWKFIGINKNLPKGGIYLSKERIKHIWGYDAVFGKSEQWVIDAEEKFKTAEGKEMTMNGMLRTVSHSKAVHELVDHLKKYGFKDNKVVELNEQQVHELIEPV